MELSRTLGMLAVLCGLAASVHAQDAAAAADGSAAPAALPRTLPPESHWRLGLAAGYGRRTNPLIQSDDIPVLVDVDIAYFGKRWFFDNGDLGVEIANNDRFTTNIVARVNSDRAFFSKTNTKYVTFTQLSGGVTVPIRDPGTGTPLAEPEPLKPPRRDYAIELGFETLFDGDWGAASVRAFHDISNTHDGYEIGVTYDYRITRGRFSFSPSFGLAYKDRRMTDYYWGVHKEESSLTLQPYVADGGLSFEVGLKTNYYMTKNFRVAMALNYERLSDSVGRSPLVEQPYVFGYFAGLAWSF